MLYEKRYGTNPEDFKKYDTSRLRNDFIKEEIFIEGVVNLVYTHNDRMIFGGIVPLTKPLTVELSDELGVNYFLERREMGVINLGGSGSITIDGIVYEMEHRDGIYICKESKEVIFKSNDVNNPAKYYINSTPAHHIYPIVKIDINKINPLLAGEDSTLNNRMIYQYIHPNVCESCQLQMGLTILKPGSIWNTMPCHTHDRRMEVYFYFDMEEETRVFHYMGQPDETRHLILKNEQAVISPSWSIHTGCATSTYTFIWGMCGENITYTDMDHVAMKDLK